MSLAPRRKGAKADVFVPLAFLASWRAIIWLALSACATPTAGVVPLPEAAAVAPDKRAEARVLFTQLRPLLEMAEKGQGDLNVLSGKLQEVLTLDPSFQAARYDLALVAERTGQSEASQSLLEQLTQKTPMYVPAAKRLGAWQREAGDLNDAGELYAKLVEQEPGDVDLLLELATLRLRQERLDEVNQLCRRVLQKRADSLPAFRLLAESLMRQKKLSMAKLTIGRGLALEPQDARLNDLLVQVLLTQKEMAAALFTLDELIKKAPEEPIYRQTRAELALQHEDYAGAATHLRVVHKHRPDDPAVAVALGAVLRASGALEDAEGLYKEVIQRTPDEPHALWNLALLYHHHAHRHDDAVALYDRMIATAGASARASELASLRQQAISERDAHAASEKKRVVEKRRLEATSAACRLLAQGKNPDIDSIGDAAARIQSAQEVITEAKAKIDAGSVDDGLRHAECAFVIVPSTPEAKTQACAPMRVFWAQVQYALGAPDKALTQVRLALQCDPENAVAQDIERQLLQAAGGS